MESESDDQSVNDENDFEEESSAASTDLDAEEIFSRDLPRVRNNDPDVKHLCCEGDYDIVQNMTNEGWEDIGRDISNNTYLETLDFNGGALDDEKLSSLFRGLTKSSSIVNLDLDNNEFSRAGLISLEPFLQNSIKLREFDVTHNNIQSGGFNSLLQALHDSPIEYLFCAECGISSIEIASVPTNLRLLSIDGNHIQSEGFNRLLRSLRDSSIEVLKCINCGIESIEIDADFFPRSLKELNLRSNRINTNGCRGVAKLLQKTNALEILFLSRNMIGDEGVATLVDALKTNTSLSYLDLEDNDGISNIGHILILKMLNDISSIKATLHSNHTLRTVDSWNVHDDIEFHINMATTTNRNDPIAAGREKVIQTQLHSRRRAKLVGIQGLRSQSVYGEINPLHLPEVLSLVSRRHGQEELYLALKASIAELLSTVNRTSFLQQRRAYHAAMLQEIDAELAAIKSAKGDAGDGKETHPRGIKRLRV